MKINTVAFWLIQSLVGTIIYSILIWIFLFPINNDFTFDVSEKIIISIVITVISLFLSLPILLFNKLIETFNLPNNFSSYTIIYAVLMIASLTVLLLLGMRGFYDFLAIFLAYGTSGLITLLILRRK